MTLKTKEMVYSGKNMPDLIMLHVTGVGERWAYEGPEGAKVKSERYTFNNVPVSRIRGAGLVGGDFEKNVILDVPEEIAASVSAGLTLIAREHSLVNIRQLKGDFAGTEISAFAATVEVIGTTQDVLSKIIGEMSTRTSAPVARNNKEVA